MARMIPPYISSGAPTGEKHLFEKLRDDPAAVDWVVFHSLDIKKHQTKIEGEIDMMVLVPGVGILCIEVKSCDVYRKDGLWIYPYGRSSEGPFKQASRAMHSLREYLAGRDSTLSGLLFFSAVIFTHADFDEDSPEWYPWQSVSRTRFLRFPISRIVIEILEKAHLHVQKRARKPSWYDVSRSRPTEGQARRITGILRSDFEYPSSLRTDIHRIEDAIRHFTEEQFEVLDLLQENHRIVFKGPAGTGKTFLAIEVASRAQAEGKSIAFVCFNNLLSDWLRAKTASLAEHAYLPFFCGTFHRLLLDISGIRPVESSDSGFWKKRLPAAAIDRLLADNRTCITYDTLIVDEAQDLLAEEYLDVMDLLLKGGLAGGNWTVFGDFERQAIYLSEGGQAALESLEELKSRAPIQTSFGLRVNCRNAEPIAAAVSITSGLKPGYRRVLHGSEGADVDPLFFRNSAKQQDLLKGSLENLKKSFEPHDIVVLSMRRDDASCAESLGREQPALGLMPIKKARGTTNVAYGSVHAFKGLEAAAVILTDIDHIDNDMSGALLYVGMSRARIRLVMLMHERCRPVYDAMLEAGFQKTAKG